MSPARPAVNPPTSRVYAGHPTFPLTPVELQRWVRFSAKGGVGRARAKVDRVSEDGDRDLMMLEGDEVVVLMDLGDDCFLGHCEDVVGLFRGADVTFLQAKLKRPVMTARRPSAPDLATAAPPDPDAPTSLPPPSRQPSTDPTSTLNREHRPRSRSLETSAPPNPLEPVSRPFGHATPSVSSTDSRLESRAERESADVSGSGLRSRRRGQVEGLGIEVRSTKTNGGDAREDETRSGEDDGSARKAAHGVPTIRSPDLAGAFQSTLSQSSSFSSLDRLASRSPCLSRSSADGTPLLVTSPSSPSETGASTAPTTPYLATPPSHPTIWGQSGLPPSPLSSVPAPERYLKELEQDATTPTSATFAPSDLQAALPEPVRDLPPSSVAAQPMLVVASSLPLRPDYELLRGGDPSTSARSAFSSSSPSPTLDSFSSVLGQRQAKSSDSTIGSTASSIPGSVPGTPGQDETLAFIYDSYRNSVASSIPGVPITGDAGAGRKSASQAEQKDADSEVVESLEGFNASSTQLRRASVAICSDPSFGAAIQLRSRLRDVPTPPRSPVASALPPHISPGRNRHALKLSFPPPSPPAGHAAERSSPRAAQASPTPSSPHDRNVGIDGRPMTPPTPEKDQYATAVPPSPQYLFASPSSASFYSAHSTDEGHSAQDHSEVDLVDPSLSSSSRATNKLRKKPSFRLRPSRSTSRLTGNGSGSSVDLPSTAVPPVPNAPVPHLPTRSLSDPFNAPSPPASPARSVGHKKSIGRFVRSKEPEKKFNNGAGISSKDFEEETVKIGSSAFEIVKPLAALLSQGDEPGTGVEDDDDEKDDMAPTPFEVPSTPHRPYPSAFPASPQFAKSTVSLAQQSHFSPPTPASADGSSRSIEDHRAKELKWIQLLSSGVPASQVRKSKKSRALVQSGIPSSVRGKAWSFLAEADREKQPGLYESLCSLGTSRYAAVIEQDLQMMLLDHPQFADGSAGREDLISVLHAFAHHERQLGYYPGLVNVVGLLVMQMPAVDAFYVLLSLVKNYGFRQFFTVGREELRLETLAFSFLLEMVEPKIARRFRDLDIDAAKYLPTWLDTFFLSVLPLPTVMRIVDVFLLDPKTRYRAPLALLDLSDFTNEALYPSVDAVRNYLLAPPASAFSPAILCPAIANVKISEDKLNKAIKKGAQAMLTPKH
ncbi:hypothetical protein JCM10212_007139 [Sporobolomyces blumeae]